MKTLVRKTLEAFVEFIDPTPRVSMPCVQAAMLRQEMDRHPVEDMEPHREIGTSVRPGDVRKAPVFPRR